jgi:hypothetical protein
MWESARKWIPTFPRGFPIWELESHKCLKSLGQGLGNKHCPQWTFFRPMIFFWKSRYQKGLHPPFEDFKHKLWLKEWLGINLTIWLPTSKTQEIGVKWLSIGAYNMALEKVFSMITIFPVRAFQLEILCGNYELAKLWDL